MKQTQLILIPGWDIVLLLLGKKFVQIYPYLLLVYMIIAVVYDINVDFKILAEKFLDNYYVTMGGTPNNPDSSNFSSYTGGSGGVEPGGSKDPQQGKGEQGSSLKRKYEGDDSPDNRKRPTLSSKPVVKLEPCDCCSTKPCSCGGPQLRGASVTINTETSVRDKCYDIDASAGMRGTVAACCRCGTKHFFYVCSRCLCSYCHTCHSNHTP